MSSLRGRKKVFWQSQNTKAYIIMIAAMAKTTVLSIASSTGTNPIKFFGLSDW